MFETVGETLAKGEEVRIVGFGTFGNRPARRGCNPRAGKSLEIPASAAPTFKASKILRDCVKNGGAS